MSPPIDLQAMPVKIYAGIGSRETPEPILALMRAVAARLGALGWRLRTGGADGADTAFEEGAPNEMADLFLPWPSFNGRGRSTLSRPTEQALQIAARMHPAWDRLKSHVRALLARNVHQVLGADCASPASLVLCWTSDGATRETTVGTGGTGQAIRTAALYGVPVYNLARDDHWAMWKAVLS
jgi:hypothetical protein